MVLPEHFPDNVEEFYFRGGWGYSQLRATEIIVNDPNSPGKNLDGISLENVFILYRLREELEFAQPKGEERILWYYEKTEQQLLYTPKGPMDLISVAVETLKRSDFESLKKDWIDHNEYKDDPEGQKAHEAEREAKMTRYTEEYYFNIHNFF